jgi:DNA repair protein RAD5
VEEQAIDRIHRLGQTQPVTVIRYIMKHSVEERMLQIQQTKIAMISVVTGQTHLNQEERKQNRVNELQTLFGL